MNSARGPASGRQCQVNESTLWEFTSTEMLEQCLATLPHQPKSHPYSVSPPRFDQKPGLFLARTAKVLASAVSSPRENAWGISDRKYL